THGYTKKIVTLNEYGFLFLDLKKVVELSNCNRDDIGGLKNVKHELQEVHQFSVACFVEILHITNKLAGCKATGAPNCIGLAATKLQWCQQYQRCSGMEIAPAQQKCRTCCNVNNKMQPILIIKLAVQYVAIDVVGLLMSTLQVE
nr:glucose/ribitol dehydrogenase [Tanacetum cinerariifolium]